MLQFIRSNAGSWIIKVILFLVVISFGIWGVADMFIKDPNDLLIAEVGKKRITVGQVKHDVFRQINQMSQLLGGQFDLEQAKNMGIQKSITEDLVNKTILAQYYKDLNIEIGDTQIREDIFKRKQFQNEKGEFDRHMFETFLRMSHVSESQFIERYKNELKSHLLTSSLFENMKIPQYYVNLLFKNKYEERVLNYVSLDAKSQKIPAPKEDQLATYHQQNSAKFMTPEYRNISYVVLSPKEKAKDYKVSEEDLKKEYDARLDEYTKPEKRDADEILTKTKEDAEKAVALIKEGKSFDDAAKTLTPEKATVRHWGLTAASEIPSEILERVLALKQDALSDVLNSQEGFHVIKIKTIEQGSIEPLEKVKPALLEKLQLTKATDDIVNHLNTYEEDLSNGQTIEQLAEKHKLKLEKIDQVDAKGHLQNGQKVKLSSDVIKAAFNLKENENSGFQDSHEGYSLAHVYKITPPALKPLPVVHDQVVKAWTLEQQKQEAEKLVKNMASQIDQGKDLNELAKAYNLKLMTSEPFTQHGHAKDLPATLIKNTFTKTLNKGSSGHQGDLFYVGQLTKIIVPNPSDKKDKAVKYYDEVAKNLSEDYDNILLASLKNKYKVKIYEENLDQIF
jgi:peptidyl-prolyl cis-trans isomerase D